MTDTIKKHLLNAYLSLAIVSIFWGTTYYAIHVGVQYTSGFALAGLRQAIAGLLLAGYFVLRGHRLPDLKTLGKLFVIGVLMFVFSNGFVSIACQYVPSGLVAIIAATVPIWISLLGFFFLKEKKVSALLILGLLLGFVGIVGIFYDYVDDLLVPEFRLGILLAFIACLSWASGSIYFIRAHLKVNLLFGAGLQMLFAGIVMMGLSEFTSQPVTISHLPADYWWSLIYLITVGSVIGYSAYAYTLKKLPASLVSVYAYVNPIVAVILGWIFLHEKFDVITAISCTVTLLGVFIVNQSMRKAVSERIEGKIRIADYESPQDQVHFERLNRAWIEKYFRMEEIDVQVLTNPEEHILQDDPDMAPERAQVPFTHVNAADFDGALLNIVRAVQQLDRRGLAGARGADHRDFLARCDAERYSFEHRIACFIVKPDMVKDHFAAKRFRHDGVFPVRNIERSVEQLKDAFRRRHRGLHHRIFLTEVAQRHKEAMDILLERHQGADADRAVQRLAAAVPE